MPSHIPFARSPRAQRYDIYRNIHRALRACMGATLTAVGCIDVQDDDDLDAGLSQLRELLALCEMHIDKETHFVHAAMEQRRPGSSARIADEHLEHADSLQALATRVDAVAAADPATRPVLMQRLYLQLALFVAANFEHMHIEDTEHNAVLWSAFSDEELQALEGRIVASIPPAASALVLRWMLPAIAHGARVELLSGIERMAPREVFEAKLALARECLDARDWAKLEAALELVRAA